MYLIQPLLTSAIWMKPSLFSYSSSVTKAPKFLTLDTEQTTSSPSSGQSYPLRAVFASAITRGPPRSRLGSRPSRPSASRPWRRRPGTRPCSRRGRPPARDARCRTDSNREYAGASSWRGDRASIQRGTRIYGFLGVRSENFLEPADRGLDPRTRNPAAQYSGPRETWTLESQQIYIAKLINGGEIQ